MSRVLTCAFALFSLQLVAAADDSIGFPEDSLNPDLVPADNRQPLFMPNACPENELFYPGDQMTDRVCDCKPAYLYHPSTDKCHAAYERGPCNVSQYLVMPLKGFVPVCMQNRCANNGKVPYKGYCVQLGKPCDKDKRRLYGVNATTVKIECLQLQIDLSRAPKMLDCPPGCKRNQDGTCPSEPEN